MDNFNFHNPTRIIFGAGSVQRVGKEAAKLAKRVLLVYGRNSIKANGVYTQITESLSKNGLEWVEHPGVRPNPVISHVREGVKKIRENGCDLIIAAGGGSVIDESKAIAAAASYQGDAWDFFCGKAVINSALPLITVLTIPATGSEMNSGFVITNEETKQKYSSGSPFSFPKVSILDPKTTYTLPNEQAAYGAVDAVSHLVEGYFSTRDFDNIITDNLVHAVAMSVMASTARIMKDPKDYNARAAMMWSASLALNGLQSAGYKRPEFINHAIEHSISAIYDMPHGLGLAIVMPAYFKYYIKKHGPERLACFGRGIFGINESNAGIAAEKTLKTFEDWIKGLGLKIKLSENGVAEKDISEITKNAMGIVNLWRMTVTEKEVLEILKLAK